MEPRSLSPVRSKIEDSPKGPLNFSAAGLSREIGGSGEWVAFFRSIGCELGPVTSWSFPSNDPVTRGSPGGFEARIHEQTTRSAEGRRDSSINRIRLPRGETPLTSESLSPVIAALNFISVPIRLWNGTHIRRTHERVTFSQTVDNLSVYEVTHGIVGCFFFLLDLITR